MLHLKLAWLYRESCDTSKEQAALTKALEYYEKVLSKERFPVGSLTETAATYLVGDLYNHTGDTQIALKFFSNIISNRQARSEKYIYELTKEAWHNIRASMQQVSEK